MELSFPVDNYKTVKSTWPNTGKVILASFTEDTIVLYQAFNPSIANYAVENQTFENCPGYSRTRMTWLKPNFLWMMYRSGWGTKKGQERILAIFIKREGFETILRNTKLCSRNPREDKNKLLGDLQSMNKIEKNLHREASFVPVLIDRSSQYSVSSCPVKVEGKPSSVELKSQGEKMIEEMDKEINADGGNDDHQKGDNVRLQWDPDHDPLGNKMERRAIQLGIRGEILDCFIKEWIVKIEDVSKFVRSQHKCVKKSELRLLSVPCEKIYPIKQNSLRKRIQLDI